MRPKGKKRLNFEHHLDTKTAVESPKNVAVNRPHSTPERCQNKLFSIKQNDRRVSLNGENPINYLQIEVEMQKVSS